MKNLYPQRWREKEPVRQKVAAALAELGELTKLKEALTQTDRPWTLVSATRNLAEAGVVIPRVLLESVTARIARTMKRRSKSESEHR